MLFMLLLQRVTSRVESNYSVRLGSVRPLALFDALGVRKGRSFWCKPNRRRQAAWTKTIEKGKKIQHRAVSHCSRHELKRACLVSVFQRDIHHLCDTVFNARVNSISLYRNSFPSSFLWAINQPCHLKVKCNRSHPPTNVLTNTPTVYLWLKRSDK